MIESNHSKGREGGRKGGREVNRVPHHRRSIGLGLLCCCCSRRCWLAPAVVALTAWEPAWWEAAGKGGDTIWYTWYWWEGVPALRTPSERISGVEHGLLNTDIFLFQQETLIRKLTRNLTSKFTHKWPPLSRYQSFEIDTHNVHILGNKTSIFHS